MPLAEATPAFSARRAPASKGPEEQGWRLPFRPLWRNGDLQTVAAHYWPRRIDERRFPTATRLFRTDPQTQVLARLNTLPASPSASERPIVVALHGLTACDRAPYMVSTARAALDAGFDAMRLNMRNCGGTEHLCRTLYHSGLTTDLRQVIAALAPRTVFVVGYSMGGNVALKLAGEWGNEPPSHVRAVCAISPPIRLGLCSRNIGRPRNAVYEARFLRQLRAALRRKRLLMPESFPDPDVVQPRSVWDFDEFVTAPAFGFADAADYYSQCSAAGFLHRIRVPTLVIQAVDDPFIPFEAFDIPALRESPWLALLSPRHGGHVAFLAKSPNRFWAQEQAMRYFAAAGRKLAAT